ncbi:ROK family transcriptional regulator [Jiella sp. MQZ9-1]|nr:ROK family transcriptional regulator [Jiella flava]MCD2471692.1 ROK family transcriptional regulator [Jiella flava]
MGGPAPLKSTARSRNERMILEVVRRNEAIARAAITGHTNLTQQSVHRIVEELIRDDLLLPGDPVRGMRGQPSPQIMLDSDARFSLGISVNTDSATISLCDLSCRIREEVRLRVRPMSRTQTLKELRAIADRLLARNGVSFDRIVGLGAAVAGYFIADRRQVNAPEPLRDWSLVDLEPMLEDAFDLPVRLQNNATTAAIAEALRGVGLRCPTFAYLSFNYGFGGGVVVEGRPLLGANGNAGEMSSILSPDESESRPALRYLLDAVRENGVSVDSVEDLHLRFDPAWPGVDAWIAQTLPSLNRVINALAAVVDPQAIVFGGQIPPELGRTLIARAGFWARHRYGAGPKRPELLLSQVTGDAAAAGAAMLPLREAFFA